MVRLGGDFESLLGLRSEVMGLQPGHLKALCRKRFIGVSFKLRSKNAGPL